MNYTILPTNTNVNPKVSRLSQ